MLDDAAKQRWTLCRSLAGAGTVVRRVRELIAAVVEDFSPTDSILGRNFRPMLLARLPKLTDWFQPVSSKKNEAL